MYARGSRQRRLCGRRNVLRRQSVFRSQSVSTRYPGRCLTLRLPVSQGAYALSWSQLLVRYRLWPVAILLLFWIASIKLYSLSPRVFPVIPAPYFFLVSLLLRRSSWFSDDVLESISVGSLGSKLEIIIIVIIILSTVVTSIFNLVQQ